jgi:hypothetical protein
MKSNNHNNFCRTCGKTISLNKSACAACLAAPQPPRWDSETSPLKISFFAGSPHAPDNVKSYVEKLDLTAPIPEHCLLLPWRDAFAALLRCEKEWFHFHPQDFDWQVNGWQMDQAGLFHLAPLTVAEVSVNASRGVVAVEA